MSELGIASLITLDPEAGFDLAVKLARTGIKVTQPDPAVRNSLRTAYDHDSAQLIASSHVIAIHFQTVAAANMYWRVHDGSSHVNSIIQVGNESS